MVGMLMLIDSFTLRTRLISGARWAAVIGLCAAPTIATVVAPAEWDMPRRSRSFDMDPPTRSGIVRLSGWPGIASTAATLPPGPFAALRVKASIATDVAPPQVVEHGGRRMVVSEREQ
jgi:hypothetical protein